MELAGKKVAILGLGKSGLAAARLALRRGASVAATDRKSADEVPDAARELAAAGVDLRLGRNDPSVLEGASLLVVSPGVAPNEVTAAAESIGARTVSEIELASWWIDAPIVAITGTNGKSTVTTLVGELLRSSGYQTFVGGNLGTPLADVVDTAEARATGRVVCELSSFQLERIDRFRAHVAVLLNITPDHLDRYSSFDAYADAKGNLFASQLGSDHAVIDLDDGICAAQARRGSATIHGFGASSSAEVQATKTALVDRVTGESYSLAELKLRGGHNVLNAAASVLAARLAGATPDATRRVLATFEGLAHRMRFVGRIDGVDYYDDSKATNVAAAVAAIDGVDGSVVLIAGGVDKGGGYAPLVSSLRQKGRAVVTLGQAAAMIESALGGAIPTRRARSMAEAVGFARAFARSGDTVLLAPACASFDMFANYAERGDVFVAAVRALESGGG